MFSHRGTEVLGCVKLGQHDGGGMEHRVATISQKTSQVLLQVQ